MGGNQHYYQLGKVPMIRNNKAQSMITVMLLLMILGVIVTLIVSSTLTDTRKLLVQKSYERAYSLAEQYLTKIINGNVLGAGSNNVSSILTGSASSGLCTPISTNITDYTSSVNTECKGVGSDNASIVNCSRTPEVMGMALKIQPDEPVNLDYSKNSVSGAFIPFNLAMIQSASPKIYLRYKNADAVQVTYKYEETISGVSVPKSVSFIISTNQEAFPGALPIPSNVSAPDALTNIVNKTGSLGPVIKTVSDSSPSQSILDALSSVSGISIKELSIDLYQLASNIKIDGNHTAKSLQIKFLKTTDINTSPGVVEFAIYHDYRSGGVTPPNEQQFAFQFHKYKCNAFDSAYDSTNTDGGTEESKTKGFGSARLEAYIPINKALPDFFDYSLFVGGGVGGNSATGYPVIINK